MEIAERLQSAVGAHRRGEAAEAEAAYTAILAEQPDQADALHFLGLLRYQRGDADGGVDLVQRSIAANPSNAAAHNNLGNMLKLLGRGEEAVRAYVTALKLDGGNADSLNNIGLLLRQGQRGEAAIHAFRDAIRFEPDHPEAWHNLGVTLFMLDQREEAAEALERAAMLGENGPSQFWLSQVLCTLGRREAACAIFERLLERRPDDPIAAHQLAALRGTAPERASDAYVRVLFDGFSDTFDDVLTGLDYQAPQLVAAMLARRVGEGPPLGEVVDLGCGTGMCGRLIRSHCRRLVGVDLSEGMLRKAAATGSYDQLAPGELVAFLESSAPGRFDLALCADTLNYLGSLSPFMRALAAALKPGGALIATVERLDDPEADGVRIGHSGRYMHAEAHLRRAADQAGLAVLRVEDVVLRKEMGASVHGLLFEIERPGAPA